MTVHGGDGCSIVDSPVGVQGKPDSNAPHQKSMWLLQAANKGVAKLPGWVA
jgi:hypothetical protein